VIERIWLKIGEAASAVGVTAKDLRYWERVIPELQPRRSRGNLRYYHVDELPRLKQIQAWITEGLSVVDCRELLLTGQLSRQLELDAAAEAEEDFQLQPAPNPVPRIKARRKPKTEAPPPEPEEDFQLLPAPDPVPQPKPRRKTQAKSQPPAVEDDFQLQPPPSHLPRTRARRKPRTAEASTIDATTHIVGLEPVKKVLRALVKRLSRPPRRS